MGFCKCSSGKQDDSRRCRSSGLQLRMKEKTKGLVQP